MIKKCRIRLWAFWKVGSGPERSRKSDPAMRVLESRICMALSILESRIRPWAFWKVGLIRAIWKSCPYSVKWCQEPQQHGYKLRDQRLLLKMHLLINSLYICTLFFRCVINLLIYIVHRTGNAAAYGDSEREWDMFDLKIVILQFLTDLVQTRHKHSLPYSDKWENIVFTNK